MAGHLQGRHRRSVHFTDTLEERMQALSSNTLGKATHHQLVLSAIAHSVAIQGQPCMKCHCYRLGQTSHHSVRK